MSTRYEVRSFTPDLADGAGGLLAERHRRQRLTVPALNADFEHPKVAAQRVAELAGADDASGAAVFVGERMVGYILGAPKSDPTWGPNVWIQDGGCAGSDPEAIRQAFAVAGAAWVDEGWTRQKAEAELRHVLADVERGLWAPGVDRKAEGPKSPTFHELASAWLETRRGELGEATIADYT